LVEEQLPAELADGWRIKEIVGFGGGADTLAVRGSLAVLLEKQ
jgi:hypothetical protein